MFVRGTTVADLGVGIIGANPDGRWAGRSHVPAIAATPGVRLASVATTRRESAVAAAGRFGADRWFTSAAELAADSATDLAVIAVRVPQHRQILTAVLAAGTDVLCEWPLARTTAEAEEMVAAAAAARVRGWVGLQARFAPEVVLARTLIGDGFLGRLTSVHAWSSMARGASGIEPPANEYLLDAESGANLLTIGVGHTLDTIETLVGHITEVAARTATQRPTMAIAGTGRTAEVRVPDHVLVHGLLGGDALFSVDVHNGQPAGCRTVVELVGTEGVLRLHTEGKGNHLGVQMSRLALFGARGDRTDLQRLDAKAMPDLPDQARNVAGMYAALAAGADGLATFEDGLRLHRLLDAVRHSAASATKHGVDR
jgi:predicted dehydrogenase